MPRHPLESPASRSGGSIARPLLFWTGVALTSAGVALHLPMFFAMRTMHGMDDMGADTDHRVGTGPDIAMDIGMALLAAGVCAAVAGLLRRRRATEEVAVTHRLQSAGRDRLTPAHARLITALSLAMVIDIMKPATLAFVMPGMRQEYGLSEAQVSSLPVVALTGTVFGSLLWGYLGDRIGRRVTILVSALVFIATTVCAVMPTFEWNLVMCFLMGAAAGGLLPIAYAMTAETVPASQRGMVMVLQAGLATVLAYFATSALAATLIPVYGWRIMWFTHFPFAVLLLLMNRWIPESPLFLLRTGRYAEAEEVSRRFGMMLVVGAAQPVIIAPAGPRDSASTASATVLTAPTASPARRRDTPPGPRTGGARVALSKLFGRQGWRRTTVVGCYALSWGVINWGFMTFLPTLLSDSSVSGASSGSLLFWSSLLAVPGTVLVAFCYARWSSRKTMVLYGSITVLSLLLLAGADLRGGRFVTMAMLMLLISGTSGIVAIIAPYTTEVYPTAIRALGSGFAAACGKAGGMFGPPALAGVIAAFPGIRVIALIVAVPMAAATVVIARYGAETSGRELLDSPPSASDEAMSGPEPNRPDDLVGNP